MLRTLSVKNYVLIDSLEIDFPEGLIIITGQTGAGKSILLGALSLLMGAKADASVIGDGAQNCVVEAEFDIDRADALQGVLEENDVEWDGGHIVIRRVVNSTGRSRSFVNDSPVSVQLLSAVSSKLIDIHSQHQSLLLTDRSFQMSVLDFFAGNGSLLSSCKDAWASLQHIRKDKTSLESRLNSLSAEKDYNEAQFRQLESASLKEGELEELEMEQQQLANAEEIKDILFRIEAIAAPQDDSMPSMDSQLRLACQSLSKLSRYVSQADSLSERLSSVRIELSDIMDEVSSINSRISVSGERLQAVEDRMEVLYGLLKKHGCRTVGELISLRDKFGEAVLGTDSLAEAIEELNAQEQAAQSRLESVAEELHASRAASAGAFAAAVTESLRFLELDRAAFDVELDEVPVSATGRDSVIFRFSASGQAPVDLSKCASGGELSRIMLSLKAMMARYMEMPTMIFDEIDTGVSGSVADKMGSMICDMGRNMQVFAITHLPQVAAKGDAHYLVSKDYDETGRSVSSIKKLSRQERVLEVARMLSGSSITDAAVANAESLLS
ncbi:MAG: DNA repair protein RecN [Bacteroidia bacterium]|nr:DNA repair protein RecN [Bacteroidia bacterium]